MVLRIRADRLVGVTLAVIVSFALHLPPVAQAAAGLSEVERDELEAQLDEARHQLDEAAERLGELHSRLYAMETVGQHGQKPMLGVLVGERGPAGGLLLSGVTPGGGAEAAGMRAGDEITSVNGVEITDAESAMAELSEAMANVTPGQPVSVGYLREGGFHFADVTTQAKGIYIMGMTGAPAVEVDVEGLEHMATNLAEQYATIESEVEWVGAMETLENLESLEELQAMSALPPEVHGIHRAVSVVRSGGGLRLESVSGDLASYFGVESGVLVLAVPDAPEGASDMLKAGDVLLAVDGEPIQHPGDGFRTLLADRHSGDGSSAELTVEVMRQGVRELVKVSPIQFGSGASTINLRNVRNGTIDVEVVAPPGPAIPPDRPGS